MTYQIHLVTDATPFDKVIDPIKELCQQKQWQFSGNIEFREWLNLEQHDDNTIWLLHANDETIRELCQQDATLDRTVYLLPNSENPLAIQHFSLAKELSTALIRLAEHQETIDKTSLFCNGQIVLKSVIVGNRSGFINPNKLEDNFWARFWHLLGLLRLLIQGQLLPFKLTTHKAAIVNTVAFGMAIAQRPNQSVFIQRSVSENERSVGMFHTVVFAPRSISEIIHYIFTRVWPKKAKGLPLTNYLAYIKTKSLCIDSNRQMELKIDQIESQASEICLEMRSLPFKLIPAQDPAGEFSEKTEESKESMKVAALPKGESIGLLAGKKLPWIYHADQEEVKETFINLKENALASQAFIVLMILSTFLATVGLFANSAPVIIGAMILAPLMAPIISVSMGALRQDNRLILAGAKTLALGISLALFCSMIFAFIVPLNAATTEISARLSPTILDMAVAIISGIAGAYASARSEVAKSFAGVAIAVALVPPLAVSGIGIGWLDWQVFSGAMLLFITNLFGIILAAAITFLFLGFSPLYLAKKGVVFSTALVLAVSIPLVMSFNKMVHKQDIINDIQALNQSLIQESLQISEVAIAETSPLTIEITLIGTSMPLESQIQTIHQNIETQIHEPFVLRVKPVIQLQ